MPSKREDGSPPEAYRASRRASSFLAWFPKDYLGVFMVNGDSFVKQLGKDCLISHNRKYRDIRFSDYDDIRCVGRVLGLLDESDIAVV